MKNSKTCLNCVWSQYVIEADAGLYSYEGDCTHYECGFDPPEQIHHIRTDDRGELEELVHPIFEAVASSCEHYEQTGVGKPE